MATSSPLLPPLDYSITLPETVLFQEKHNPDLPVYVFARDDSNVSGVTYHRFANACRRIPQLLGISREEAQKKPVVAVVANADTLIYHTIVLGLMLIGAVPFPISPRNTSEAVVNLIKRSACHYLVTTSATLLELKEGVLHDLASDDPTWGLNVLEAPLLGQLYPEHSTHPKVDEPTSPSDAIIAPSFQPDDVALYLHSSGSTGLPKAIPRTHRELVNYIRFPTTTVYRAKEPRVLMSCMELPAFHAMAVVLQVGVPFFHGACSAIFPPQVETPQSVPVVPSPDKVLLHVERTKANGVFTIPAFLHAWTYDPRGIEILRRLDFVAFGGGALSGSVGEALYGNGVKLRAVYGGTEFGAAGISSTKPGDEGDWEWFHMTGEANPIFAAQGDGTYELQFISLDGHPRTVCNIPGVPGYATSDLFIPHPTKDYLWKHVGRIDDVLVHSSGEKTVPGPMEFIMNGSSHVKGAVMFGVGRDQPGVLFELKDEHAIDVTDSRQVAAMRSLLWSLVSEANQGAPAFSKIYKELILFTAKDKPLPRTPKGTIPAKSAWKLYAAEIEAAYSDMDAFMDGEMAAPESWTEAEVASWILSHVCDLCSNGNIDPNGNLFEQGLDSLSGTILRRRIRVSALRSLKDEPRVDLTQSTIYAHPTVNSLAAYLTSSPRDGVASTRIDAIERMIAKYSFVDSPFDSGVSSPASSQDIVVLLTGSTGSLGSHILEGLLRDTNVGKVYTLNRQGSSPSAERHLKQFQNKGLDVELLSSEKLVHISSDCSADNLGLSVEQYDELKSSVDVIIHVAWRLDFNMSIESFEPNVRATHNLAALARASSHAETIRFIFTSSIGVAQSWDMSLGAYPEALVTESKYAQGLGYGEAKYVAERLLATSGLNSTSVRIGQITGSESNGAWATSDWVPILLKSSIALDALPSAQGNISWLSADAVSRTILDLAHSVQRYPKALNIIHPEPITWDLMIQHVQQSLESEVGTRLPIVYYQDWFSKLDNAFKGSHNSDDLTKIPAIKLHDFFFQLSQGDLVGTLNTAEVFGSPDLAIGQMKSLSQSLAGLGRLEETDIQRWVKYWAGEGFFNN